MSPAVAMERLADICRSLGLDEDQTKNVMSRRPMKNRHPAYVAARALVVASLRDQYGMSFPEIQGAIGSKSSATPQYLYQLASAFRKAGE